MKKLIMLCGVGLAALTATSAQATVEICDGNCADFADNVLVTSNDTPAFQQSGTAGPANILFTSSELIIAPSNGQARIEAEDGVLNDLTFELLDGYAFGSAVFNLFNASLADTEVTITYWDPNLLAFVDETFALANNGQNFMGIYGTAGETFTKVAFKFAPGGIHDLRQLRFDGVQLIRPPVVPEPATWAMMVAGLGLVGLGMRRRANTRVSFV